jgi:hypothetical protein
MPSICIVSSWVKALGDSAQRGAAIIKRGFDEQRAHTLHRNRVDQELAAVSDRPQKARLQNAAVLVAADRRGGITPVALQQLPHFLGVRRHDPAGRKQAVDGPPAGRDGHDRAAHELTKRGIGSASRLKRGQFARRHDFHNRRPEPTDLTLLTPHLGEPFVKARSAHTGLHRQHPTQRRDEIGVATQQRLRRLAHVRRARLKLLTLTRADTRAPQQHSAQR